MTKNVFETKFEGNFIEEEALKLKYFEGSRKSLVESKEVAWQLKSRVTWVVEGDNKTKFFYKYATYRKSCYTIWDLEKTNGSRAFYFEDIVEVVKCHFQSLFNNYESSNIEEIRKVV